MNKITKTLCMMAVVALAFTSCKKQETPTDSVVFNHSMEQLVTVNDEGNFEKVYLDNNNQIAFEVGDSLMVFDIRENGSQSSCGLYRLVTSGDHTLLTVCPDETEVPATTTGSYYVFYPGKNVVSTNFSNENRATFRLDATQTYRTSPDYATMLPKNALYIAAKAEEQTFTEAYFTCKNICGVLQLNFYSPTGKKIKKIEVTDNSFNIVGDLELKIDEVDPEYMSTLFSQYGTSTYDTDVATYMGTLGYNASNKGNKVTLDCTQVSGGSVAVGTEYASATPFYIVMRPLALLNGYKVKVTLSNNKTKTFSSDKNNVIKPNTIRNMKALNIG